jgi:hypothetical protein
MAEREMAASTFALYPGLAKTSTVSGGAATPRVASRDIQLRRYGMLSKPEEAPIFRIFDPKPEEMGR